MSEIDKWKIEVQNLFANSHEEKSNFKRYKDHYKTLQARATPFQIELAFTRDLQKKTSFIDWRSRVEEIIVKIQNQERIGFESILHILEDGEFKGFLTKNE